MFTRHLHRVFFWGIGLYRLSFYLRLSQARRMLEEAAQADDDEDNFADDARFLNMNEEDGK